jgi:hypothetical protein
MIDPVEALMQGTSAMLATKTHNPLTSATAFPTVMFVLSIINWKE